MRILHIDSEPDWRGGQNQLRLLLAGLANEVTNHVAIDPSAKSRQRFQSLASVHSVPMVGRPRLRAISTLREIIRREKIDVVDAHSSKAHTLAIPAVWRTSIPIVVHRRVDYPPGMTWFQRWKYQHPHVQRYVAISQAIRSVLVEYGISPDKIAVVRSATEPTPFRSIDKVSAKQRLAQHLGVNDQICLIGNASALTDQKGYETLLRGIARLKKADRSFHCIIAGDGHLRPKLERMRIDLGLDECLSFLGHIEEVPEFLAALDILAVPSNYEGLGTILLDGTHAGCVLVGSDVGGIPEVIDDGKTGLLVPVGDDAILADRLSQLIIDNGLRQSLVVAAQQKVAREFSVSKMVSRNLGVYRSVSNRD